MSTTRTIYPSETLIIENGPPEFALIYVGENPEGKIKYNVKEKGKAVKKQTLSGQGSMQSYENIHYPVKIKNKGAYPLMLSAAD